MSDPSKTFSPTNCADSHKRTSLPESESGPAGFAQKDGPMIGQSGPEVARANLSARQAKAMGLMTSGTFGQPSSISSESAALQKSLESRLRAKTVSPGWSLYKLTWKHRAMPSGRSILALRASPLPKSRGEWAEHIFASARIGEPAGWATPTTRDHKDGTAEACKNVPVNALLGRQVHLAGWPTPCQQDGPKGGPNQGTDRLPGAVHLAGWPTPTSKEAAGGEYKDPEKALKRVLGPHANDLRDFAKITLSTGSHAETVSGGRLRAGHSRWLMRIPAEWESCAPLATRSTKRRRKPS